MIRGMLMAGATVAGLAAALWAQPASQPAEKHPYEITPKAGPWAICVTVFFDNIDVTDSSDPSRAGQPAERVAQKMAIEFVTELRRDYKLQAYIFNRGDDERKKEDERAEAERKQRWQFLKEKGLSEEQIKQRKYWRKGLAHTQDQYMVLVGGFQEQDAAREFLDALRKMKPPSKRFMSTLVAGLEQQVKSDGADGAYVNPFKTSFVVPNPTMKMQKAQPTPEDMAQFDLAQFNTHNPYNLLKHAGKWTLVIKAYRSPTTMTGMESRGVVDRGPSTGNSARMLEAMGKQAEQLAKVLRTPQLNFDAYVMHANYFSLVTVGIFESPNDPRMAQMVGTLSKLRLDTTASPEQLISPPQPMMVPKKK